MSEIKGIYAASLSVLDKNLALNVEKTIKHAENLIKQGCHGVVLLGSTGQAQLLSIGEKVKLLTALSLSKNNKKFIIGTGLNSLSENISLIKIAQSLDFKKFLIMPPAYYNYGDLEVVNFYSKIVEQVKDCKIILYNFEKLCGYKFSKECVETLVKKFPNQIVGIKDSSYNLYDKLKLKNFSILPGSETKLLEGLKIGCSGIITATCNVTAELSRKVYDDFHKNREQTFNEKLCSIRKVFDKFNLISALHTICSENDKDFEYILPSLRLLNEKEKKLLYSDLEKIDFNIKNLKAA